MNVLRSIGAVIGGFVAIVLLSIAIDMALEATILPGLAKAQATTAEWLFVTAYRAVISIAGCYLAARLAPSRPMAHAVVLGQVGVVVSCLGAYFMRDVGPYWYPIALIAIAVPCAWIGGGLYTRKRGSAAA